jgi:hypothetical protein
VNVRFDGHEPVGPILSKRDQRRIIMMVCALGLVLFAVKLSSNPDFWKSLFPDRFARQTVETSDQDEFIIRSGKTDETRPLEPGAFFAESNPNEELSAFDRRNAIDDSFIELNAETDPSNGDRAKSPFPADVLNGITDNTMGVRANESDAYYLMLAAAIRQPKSDRLIQKNATFPVLMTNPDYYRGAPVQITGKLKRLVPFPAGENRFRIMNLYDAWIFTRESGNRPYHIVCSFVEDLPVQDSFDTAPEVTVTGYFFKREGYSTQSGTLNMAPLILAGTIKQRPAVADVVASEDGQIEGYLSWFAIIVAAALCFTMWNFFVSDRTYRHSRANQSLAPPPNADLDGLESIDINEFLREMSEPQEVEERLGSH